MDMAKQEKVERKQWVRWSRGKGGRGIRSRQRLKAEKGVRDVDRKSVEIS